MPSCCGWRISRVGAASKTSSSVCASLLLLWPVCRPSVAIERACRVIWSFVARPQWCHVRVLASWGPLWVLSSLYSPATEILPFFLESFEVVVEWFSSSHCWSLLHWRHLSVCRPALAGDCYLSGLQASGCGLLLRVHARVWMVAGLPLLREWWTATSHVPLMLYSSTGIYFRSLLASSRLSFVWDFSGLVQVSSCLALSVPIGVRSVFSPAGFFSLWLCLVERI